MLSMTVSIMEVVSAELLRGRWYRLQANQQSFMTQFLLHVEEIAAIA